MYSFRLAFARLDFKIYCLACLLYRLQHNNLTLFFTKGHKILYNMNQNESFPIYVVALLMCCELNFKSLKGFLNNN